MPEDMTDYYLSEGRRQEDAAYAAQISKNKAIAQHLAAVESKPPSHPGTPQKAVYTDCPACHCRAAESPRGYYCPDCGWKSFEDHTNAVASSPITMEQVVEVTKNFPTADSIENEAQPNRKCVFCGSNSAPRANPNGEPLCQACYEAFHAVAHAAPYHGPCGKCGKPVYHYYPSFDKNPAFYTDAKPYHDECQFILHSSEQSTPEQIMIDGLMVSTDTLPYHLIPAIALQRLAERIQLGEEKKGKEAWNALSDNQYVLDSKKALARRIGHLTNHAYQLLAKIQLHEAWTEEDEKEASAVMWGGMYLICAIHQQRKNQDVRLNDNSTSE